MNQCILVGKVIELSKENNQSLIILEIKRPCYGDDPNATVDVISIQISDYLQDSISGYVKVGATLGVKARIQLKTISVVENAIAIHEIIAEKITFISAKENSNRE